MKPIIAKNKKKKFESAFGTINLTDGELNKYYISKEKTLSEIKNFDKIFDLIQKINDTKTFNSIKKELEKRKAKLNRKLRNQNRSEFTSHLINLDNYKDKIKYNENNPNNDGEFLYNLMFKLGNRNKIFFDRRSSVYSILSSGKPRKKNIINKENFLDLKNNNNPLNDSNEDFQIDLNPIEHSKTDTNFNLKKTCMNRKQIYENNHIPLYTKTLRPELFKILTQVNKQERFIERKHQTDLENFHGKKSRTLTYFFDKDELPKLNLLSQNKKKVAYFKDNSKFNYPEVNKIIYKEMGKTDYFEIAKKKFIEKYKYEKNEREKARLWAIQQRQLLYDNEDDDEEESKTIQRKITHVSKTNKH